jgi:tetratricopeptide (TPR) repeat protein
MDKIGLTVLLSDSNWESSGWAGPYHTAIDAILVRNYHLAIAFLKQAVAADPQAETRKLIHGVYRIDYNPYYYLGVAHLELGQHDKARAFFNEARSNLPRALQPNLERYERQLRVDAAAA